MKQLTIELTPHPINANIYNDGADAILIESVRANGILELLIVDHNNRIISGHRRWDAARKLQLKEVPVEGGDGDLYRRQGYYGCSRHGDPVSLRMRL